MEEVKQQTTAPELSPKPSRRKAPIIAALLLLLLAAAYGGLCLWVNSGARILPNVQVGDIPVGGLTCQEAAQQVGDTADARFAECTVTLTYGEVKHLSIPGSYIAADREQAAALAYQVGRKDVPLPLYGLNYLKALTTPTRVDLPILRNEAFPDGDTLLERAFAPYESILIQPLYVVEEAAVSVTKGEPGFRYDRQAAQEQLMQAIVDAANGDGTAALTVEPVFTQPDPIDWEAIADRIYVAPADAALDSETRELVPSVTGVSLDLAEAARLYEQTPDGGSFTVPFTYTEPAITTELLFRDKLGQAYSWISGVENRVSNVKFAGELCNDTILLPGDEFSYWSMIDPCTREQGFLPAPTYLDGQTVDGIGGGICQMSSSIYTAALEANLEILERRPHTYAVGYLPDGSDAMVSGGSSDFRFRNNTDYPIRIVVITSGRNLTVQLWGTKTDDTYVKMQFVELSRTPPETIYKADPTIPLGTTKESVTPYTGRKTEAYRCVYSGDGTLLSKTLESVNNYRKRDQIILCNPAELHLYDPTVPNPTPTPSAEPSAAPSAEPSVTPAPSQEPVAPPTPSETIPPTAAPSEAPAATGTPVEIPLPTESASPSQPPAEPTVTPIPPTPAPEG